LPHKGYKQSAIARKRMSEAHKQRYKNMTLEQQQQVIERLNKHRWKSLTPEMRKKGGESRKRYYQEHEVWNKGIPHSEETKRKKDI